MILPEHGNPALLGWLATGRVSEAHYGYLKNLLQGDSES